MAQTILRWIIRLLFPLAAKIELIGLENLPKQGGFVIASNHLGRLDTAVLFYAVDRRDIILPTAEKYKHHWFFGPVIRGLGGLFIDRFNPDISAVREVIKRMKNGSLLVIAPEGTRSRTEAMQEGKPGVVFFAAQARVPVVPAGLAGTEDRTIKQNLFGFRRSHIVVRVGQPYEIKIDKSQGREAGLQQATDDLMCRIAALVPEKYRGVYTSHPMLAQYLPGDGEP